MRYDALTRCCVVHITRRRCVKDCRQKSIENVRYTATHITRRFLHIVIPC